MTMDRFLTLDAVACPLPLANIDTDQLIPARFMKTPRSEGYGRFLLHDLRFDEASAAKPGFALDAPRHQGAQILVTRRSFGSGSSREAAVYALWDFGIRCVIAPSFGDIFASNAVKNGLLPATVSEADGEFLLAALAAAAKPHLTVDLDACRIIGPQGAIPFSIDPVRRLQLLNGWDDLDLSLRHADSIDSFKAAYRAAYPWARPSA
jgi:3-isopropylmalate/(R)-2-methylmalate dehydratase small subunit